MGTRRRGWPRETGGVFWAVVATHVTGFSQHGAAAGHPAWWEAGRLGQGTRGGGRVGFRRHPCPPWRSEPVRV